MEINFPKLEERTLKFWQKNKIFEKSIARRKKAPSFVFYEGPPTANARPGIHHVLARIFKDIICRYRTMRGFKVLRKAGWDTHGLPVELEIEKKLGLKNKKDIEKYGIAKFNQKCKKSVWRYKRDWERLTERVGFWLDMENPYITYETDYIETVWWILKEIYKKGLLYRDYKVVPYCPRCGTSLSSHEVALGYKNIKEPAIFVKFKILNPEFKDSSLLVWTTTPWTLPGNVAVAVNPDFVYVEVKAGGDYLILAKERMRACEIEGEVSQELKGKDLLGLRYESLYSPDGETAKSAYKVIPGNFVSLEEGTGLVHIAPAFGEEDMAVGKKNNLPVLLNVDGEGKFTLDVKKWAGISVKEADPLIIDDLRARHLLFKEEQYLHDYPFCWRCDSPLLYYAKRSWFIRMSKVKENLIKNNQKINWLPAYLKKGRFGEWLKEIKDWALSRERYWGTPLPVWQCEKCGNLEIIGSKKNLVSQKFSENKYFILRHGHSLRNEKNITSCWPEKSRLPLTKKGERQIKEAAEKIKREKIDLIFSSDLLRTKQTAEILAKELKLKPKFDKRLREVNVGIFNGKPMDEIGRFWDETKKLPPLEYYSKRFKIAPKKGENYVAIEKRLLDFMKEIEGKHKKKNILIVGHQRPFTLLEKVMSGHDLKRFVSLISGKKEIKTGEVRRLEFKNLPYDKKMELDFHRPYIDRVEFFCKKCDSKMKRVPEIIDCWFDSGSMPFAQYHYPFENKKMIDKKLQFPADYISEAIDQTRGWFYTLLAISTLLKFNSPYKNVISLGHVLDEKGEKMSKSKGNVVNPWGITKKYGADAARWYFYTVNQPGDTKLFSEKDVETSLRKFIITFWNCYLFYDTYRQKNSKISPPAGGSNSKYVLDKWVISRLNKLISDVTDFLEKYNVTVAARSIEKFVIEDLSLWYVRRSRKRFQKPETEKELKEASQTLEAALLALSRLAAPFVPFLSEEIYRKIHNRSPRFIIHNSVHLEDFPRANKKLISQSLNKKMQTAREVVAKALAERARVGIRVRQPLNELRITNNELRNESELLELIKEEVNVKKISFGKSLKLSTEITPELKEEGLVREVIRNIQEMRKKTNLKPKDKILVRYFASPNLNKILDREKDFILKEAKLKDFLCQKKTKQTFDLEKEIKVEKEKIWMGIKKI